MFSKVLFVVIGIAIGLTIGFGVGFRFTQTLESENNSQVLDVQLMKQMMTDDPSVMQDIIMNTMKDSDQMKMMEDMMQDMMERMQNDPELKQAMMERMERMKESRESMMMNSEDQMVNGMMRQSSQQMMEKNNVSFSNIQVMQITNSSVVVKGNTDKAVICQVEYGTNNMFTNIATDDMDMMNMEHYKHEIVISELKPNTEYNYRFKATIDEQTFYSEPKVFMTES